MDNREALGAAETIMNDLEDALTPEMTQRDRARELLRWNGVDLSCACDGCCDGGCPLVPGTNVRAERPRATPQRRSRHAHYQLPFRGRSRRVSRGVRSRFRRMPRGVRILVGGWAVVTSGALIGAVLGAIIHAVEQLLENLS